MAEPTNELVVKILRQMQEVQSDQTNRLKRVEKRIDEVHESMITALGLAGHANLRHDSVNERLDELTRRVEDLERTK